MPSRFGARAAMLFGLGLFAALAWAAPGVADDDMALARRLYEAGKVLSLQEVVARARVIRPGTLIDARLVFEPEHEGYVYQMLMLDARGAIWEVELDAATGNLVEQGQRVR